jgi:hypothetical protein
MGDSRARKKESRSILRGKNDMRDADSEHKMSSPFPAIDRVDVSPERIAGFKNERDYVGLGLDLMIETGSYITIAANILGPAGTWTRDQAAATWCGYTN